MRHTLVVVASLGLAAYARADGWQIVELPAAPPGWVGATPRAINASGQLTGDYRDGPYSFYSKAFFFDGVAWTSLAMPGSLMSYGWGINDRGDVVGQYTTSSWDTRAYAWKAGSLVDLAPGTNAMGINDARVIAGTSGSFAQTWSRDGSVDVFGTFGGTCRFSWASAINSRGQAVGYASTANGSHAFLWDPRTGLTDLGTLGGPTSWATAINDAGHVVGQSDTATTTSCVTNQYGTYCIYERHPFLWIDGELIDLGTLGGPDATPRGINNDDQIAGDATTGELLGCHVEGGLTYCNYNVHAFVWSAGTMHDLGAPGLRSFATGINDSGDIAGWAESAPRTGRAVMWQPQ